jgi:hypothetical protein
MKININKDKIMTQQEFTALAKVEVTEREYRAIEEVYLNSDLDKYEFAKMWMKMNKSRVQAAKEEARAKAEKEAIQDKAYKLFNATKREDSHLLIAMANLSLAEQEFLENIGITIDEPYIKTLSTINYELGQYLTIFK